MVLLRRAAAKPQAKLRPGDKVRAVTGKYELYEVVQVFSKPRSGLTIVALCRAPPARRPQ